MINRPKWEQTWRERPVEEARNFNPAFCGELIYRSVSEYFRLRRSPFSLALAFLVLPIVLHRSTREELPGNASAAFVGWTAEHNDTLATLPDRTARLVPISREALLFLAQHNAIVVDKNGIQVGKTPIKLTTKLNPTTNDVADARRAAALIGRWFANQGQPASIMQALGVTL